MSEVTVPAEPAVGHPEPDDVGAGGAARTPAPVGGARADRRSSFREAVAARWPLSRLISVGVLALALCLVLAVVLGGRALGSLDDERGLVVNGVDPATQEALRLGGALLDQENGVRGYALGANADLLTPYSDGVATEEAAVARLRELLTSLPSVRPDLDRVVRGADTWRIGYAEPTIAAIRASGRPDVSTDIDRGKAVFDQVRGALAALQGDLDRARAQGVAALNGAADTVATTGIVLAAALLLILALVAMGLRAAAVRPLTRLAGEVRQVAGGDFEHDVARTGPREVRELGVDVNRMRQRILHELSAVRAAHAVLDARTEDLERSNAELEQFAYVASHDLQEPLRKVTSFCQLLERRYKGQLDERADQYIAFAVDGAKRMQVLINDLLAFSRVGRITRERTLLSCTDLVEQARANLAISIEQTGATIEVGELPEVLAEAPLLTAVFQNLIGNAVKFRGEQPPHIVVDATRDGEFWRFSVSDNGIGIDPEYAERIFVIFQRLHAKDAYPGTGIGLAMCRKIVEYHGGSIWLDTGVESGTRFCFTLPAPPESTENIENPENPDDSGSPENEDSDTHD